MKSLPISLAALVAFGSALPSWNEGPAPAETRLQAPARGTIPVAFVLTEGAVMIDFAGPWEVFQDVHVESRGESMEAQMPFELFTVSQTRKAIRTSGGMQVIPDHTFDDAPAPRVVVIPAQGGRTPKMLEWIRKMTTRADVVMSVCTGAFELGAAGVLKGKKATTHHGAYAAFQREFPDVRLQRNMRYVQSDPVIFTAGGLTSGIDLALHVVELYWGRDVAEKTARHMEYEGKGWLGDGSAAASFDPASSSSAPAGHPSDGLTGGVLGNWRGTVQAIEGSLRFEIHIWRDGKGQLAGTVDDVDEDQKGLPITAIAQTGSGLHLEVGGIQNAFDGRLDADGKSIAGTWTLRHGTRPITFQRSGS